MYDHPMCEKDKTWLAATIDGEGCIGLHYSFHFRYNNWRITIANTNLEFVKEAQRIVKCGHICAHQDKRNPHYLLMYHLEINVNHDVLWILKQILPYLIVKKQKAMMVIKWLERKNDG